MREKKKKGVKVTQPKWAINADNPFIDETFIMSSCPVCGTPVETEDVCQVCNWENTGVYNIDGGPNRMTLAEAREAWRQGKRVD